MRVGSTTGSASGQNPLKRYLLGVRFIKSGYCDLVSKNSSKSKGGTIWTNSLSSVPVRSRADPQTYLFLFNCLIPLRSQLLHGRGRNRARTSRRMHTMRPLPLGRQLVPHIVHPSPQRGGIPNLEFKFGHSGTLRPICRGFR